MKTTCFLVIDVQQALVEEGPHESEAFLAMLQSLLTEARRSGTPVVHVRHGDEGLVPGTPGWQTHAAVAPQDGEPTFDKSVSSCFRDTALDGWLRDRGIDHLVIAGMQTEYCLDASIKSAFERGYRVTVPAEGHTTFDNRGMTADQIKTWYAHQIWDGRFASVKPASQVLEELRS